MQRGRRMCLGRDVFVLGQDAPLDVAQGLLFVVKYTLYILYNY